MPRLRPSLRAHKWNSVELNLQWITLGLCLQIYRVDLAASYNTDHKDLCFIFSRKKYIDCSQGKTKSGQRNVKYNPIMFTALTFTPYCNHLLGLVTSFYLATHILGGVWPWRRIGNVLGGLGSFSDTPSTFKSICASSKDPEYDPCAQDCGLVHGGCKRSLGHSDIAQVL